MVWTAIVHYRAVIEKEIEWMCLNPHDPQLMRIFHESGAFHAVCANNGGGMARDGVMQKVRYASPRTRETSSASSVAAYAGQSLRIQE